MFDAAEEAWGDFKGGKDRGVFGGLGSTLSVLTPTHWGGAARGAVDLAYRAPRAMAYEGAYKSMKDDFFGPGPNYSGVIEATKAELKDFLPETWSDIKSVFDTELLKDISKPLTYGAGQFWYNVVGPLRSMTGILDITAYVKSAAGIIGMIPAITTGTISMITHLIPDLISFPQHMFGAVNKTVSGILRRGFAIAESVGANIPIFGTLNKATTGTFRRFFAAAETFSEQTLVSSDLVERGLNRIFVPAAWREGDRKEHPYLTRWGQGVGGSDAAHA